MNEGKDNPQDLTSVLGKNKPKIMWLGKMGLQTEITREFSIPNLHAAFKN